jgi:hypothetical protein
MNVLRASVSFGALAFAGMASAQSLYVAGMTPGKFETVTIALNGGSLDVYSGPQTATFGADTFEGYCVDLLHENYPPVTFDVAPVAAAGALNNGARIAQLLNRYAGTVTTAEQGSALQLAIWDVLVDGGDGLGNGTFQASNVSVGAGSFVSTYLSDALVGVSTVATYYQPTSHGPNGDLYQGIIGPGGGHIPNDGPDPVPEPTSMAALGLGALGLLRRRARRA